MRLEPPERDGGYSLGIDLSYHDLQQDGLYQIDQYYRDADPSDLFLFPAYDCVLEDGGGMGGSRDDEEVEQGSDEDEDVDSEQDKDWHSDGAEAAGETGGVEEGQQVKQQVDHLAGQEQPDQETVQEQAAEPQAGQQPTPEQQPATLPPKISLLKAFNATREWYTYRWQSDEAVEYALEVLKRYRRLSQELAKLGLPPKPRYGSRLCKAYVLDDEGYADKVGAWVG